MKKKTFLALCSLALLGLTLGCGTMEEGEDTYLQALYEQLPYANGGKADSVLPLMDYAKIYGKLWPMDVSPTSRRCFYAECPKSEKTCLSWVGYGMDTRSKNLLFRVALYTKADRDAFLRENAQFKGCLALPGAGPMGPVCPVPTMGSCQP